ncbi:MAG: hypothetical protein AAGF94_12840 [Pseudomonadota bacterium]
MSFLMTPLIAWWGWLLIVAALALLLFMLNEIAKRVKGLGPRGVPPAGVGTPGGGGGGTGGGGTGARDLTEIIADAQSLYNDIAQKQRDPTEEECERLKTLVQEAKALGVDQNLISTFESFIESNCG